MASLGYGGLSNRTYLTQVRLTTQHATLSYHLSRSAATSSIATLATPPLSAEMLALLQLVAPGVGKVALRRAKCRKSCKTKTDPEPAKL